MRLGDILKAGGWDDTDIPTFASVIGAESGFRANARNSAPCGTRKDGSPAHAIGLGQVCTIHLDPGGLLDGWTEDDLENPVANARASKIIYEAQGWGAWTTHTTGAFKRYPNAQNQNIAAPTGGGRSLSETARGAFGGIWDTITSIPGLKDFIPDGPGLKDVVPDVVPDIPNPIDALGNATDALQKVGDFFSALTSTDTWWRIGKGYLGGTLIVLGAAGLVFVVARSAAGSDTGKAVVGAIPAGKAAKLAPRLNPKAGYGGVRLP